MNDKKNIAIIGGGPSGLIVAEILGKAGHNVTVYDRMPNVGRKFLLAGRGGLNLTHSEPLENFIKRYGAAAEWLRPYIKAFPPSELIKWCEGLGQETFVGTSGRVFPKKMKAAPLLRAWLKRLGELGVKHAAKHYWQGFEGDSLKFIHEKKVITVKPDATLLALGGASWPKLGSDGSWVEILSKCGVKIKKLEPANCGFIAGWSNYFSEKFSGTPLKSVSIKFNGVSKQGELMITKQGLEGGVIYGLSSEIREELNKNLLAIINLDLRPNMAIEALERKLGSRKKGDSLSNYLKKAGFSPLAISLLHEVTAKEELAKADTKFLAERFKNLPVKLTAASGMARAISTAGGIEKGELTDDFMLIKKPGIFTAGEMLDWEAPTGGYLLQACFSTGVQAANGILRFLEDK